MARFRDAFTGAVYGMGEGWLAAARRSVAEGIARELQPQATPDIAAAANAVARFWHDVYYERLFPLRFGLVQDHTGFFYGTPLFDNEPYVNLEELVSEPLRERFLDGDRLPPLLPADLGEESTELLPDRLLTQAALANVSLQSGVRPESRHAVRLASLVYPFLEHLPQLAGWPDAILVARFLRSESSSLPEGVDPALLAAVRDLQGFGDRTVGLGLVGVQRIKRYVFETPGLNEIRGASSLLDALTEEAKSAIGRLLGPEVVLRAVGATIMFLSPGEEDARRWVERLRAAFFRATGTAFASAAAVSVRIEDLLQRGSYQSTVKRVFEQLEGDRGTALQPLYECWPFELRCFLCRVRPADGWENLPGQADPAPLCRVCSTKRRSGQPGREAKTRDLLGWLNPVGPDDPTVLGVKARTVGDAVAPGLGLSDDDVPGFIPAGMRRALVATIYGDGNNFGAVGQKLTGLAMGLQWVQRVEKTVRAAAAIALGRATQEAARDRGWKLNQPRLPYLPFQMLALGGDDISLFAWAPVGVRFACDFLRLTDLEFRRPAQVIEGSDTPPIAFSLGMLVTDCRAAVGQAGL